MKSSPFTHLCRQLAVIRNPCRADLHTHTTFSDGTHTPRELLERALRAGLKAVAVTDHDTTAGVRPAIEVAAGRIEVIAGVEITAEFRGRELHLLGYFVEENDPLAPTLRELRMARRTRLLEMARRLKPLGVSVEGEIEATGHEISLGRRHLARLLIARGHARSLHDAFTRWLSRPELADVPKRRLPVADAIGLVRGAGGATSWAHPPLDTDESMLAELRGFGLQAVECVYPWPTGTHGKRLGAMADKLGLAVTGGSDSHDATPPTRAIGARTVTLEEVDRIRRLATVRDVCQSRARSAAK
jgi:predicted metal-dependent phosphoesterase TrpH